MAAGVRAAVTRVRAALVCVLTLGEVEELNVGGDERAGGAQVVHIELLGGEYALESCVQFGEGGCRYERLERRQACRRDAFVGRRDGRVDRGADRRDAVLGLALTIAV